MSSRGIRIGLVKPMLEAEFKLFLPNEAVGNKVKVDEALGLSVGYTSLPVQEIG